MKVFFLYAIVLLFTITKVNAQSLDCKRFKSGTFQSTYQGKTVTIKRNGSTQVEQFNDSKVSVSFVITWIADCTYTLKPNEDYFKLYKNVPHDLLLTVSINKTTDSSYTQTMSANVSNRTITTEIFKVK